METRSRLFPSLVKDEALCCCLLAHWLQNFSDPIRGIRNTLQHGMPLPTVIVKMQVRDFASVVDLEVDGRRRRFRGIYCLPQSGRMNG